MLVLCLITCIVLRALSAQALVIETFDMCNRFFYQGTEPSGMDQNAKKICQMLGYEESESTSWYYRIHYATLYSPSYKIPLYSAYTLDPDCSSDNRRSRIWHLEPQLSGESELNMVRENQNNQNIYNESQAISRDYSGTGYDRGHLNPNSFQCGDGRRATSTLTNAAPMDACFNRNHWYKWERKLRSYLLEKRKSDGDSATAFIVTGTVPDPKVRIPDTGTPEDPPRVSVPSHIWTAVCYKHKSSKRKSFSFGYIGENKPAEPDIRLMSVSELNVELSRLYMESIGSIERNQLERPLIHLMSVSDYDYDFGTHQSIEIFADDCFGDNNKLNQVKEAFQKLINLPVNEAVQMSSDIQNTYQAVNRAVRSDSISIYNNNNNIRVSEMTVKLAFDSMSTFYNVAEDLKVSAGSACLITDAKAVAWEWRVELRKREVSMGSDAVECLLVSEKQKTAADGSLCSSVYESDDSCQCNTGGEAKFCCSTPCLYQDDDNGYRCYSGQKLIKCSPRYSSVTVYGKKCLDDHPCATYGKDYYWCYTLYIAYGLHYHWGYCSPPLRNSKAKNGKYCHSHHACAKYGEKYTWCYTDDKRNYDQCCISDDCYSAVNGQTCRSDHRCGYHGYTYLWCYTDYKDNWDYCCKNCSQ